MRAAGGGARHFALGDVGSTNDEGFALAGSGEAPPFWVTARAQTKGRGRQGAGWVSVPGNLYASFVEAAGRLGLLSEYPLVLAVSLADALRAVAPRSAIAVKWPNDLLVEGRKLAGILAESRLVPPFGPVVVAGFGVNIASAPTETRMPATSLAAEGIIAQRDELFAALRTALQQRIGAWTAEGFPPVREAWLGLAHGIGRPVEVRLPLETLRGVFEGLDPGGRMVLDMGGAKRTIAAGDVFFGGSGDHRIG